ETKLEQLLFENKDRALLVGRGDVGQHGDRPSTCKRRDHLLGLIERLGCGHRSVGVVRCCSSDGSPSEPAADCVSQSPVAKGAASDMKEKPDGGRVFNCDDASGWDIGELLQLLRKGDRDHIDISSEEAMPFLVLVRHASHLYSLDSVVLASDERDGAGAE